MMLLACDRLAAYVCYYRVKGGETVHVWQYCTSLLGGSCFSSSTSIEIMYSKNNRENNKLPGT